MLGKRILSGRSETHHGRDDRRRFLEAWGGSLNISILMSTIPDHTASGLLPPFLGASPADTAMRSPYLSTPAEVVAKFGISEERRRILTGYLDHRAAIRRAGLVVGIQWLDGSFADRMPREPRDIDVVTFFVRPPNWNDREAIAANESVFNSSKSKVKYRCDAYFTELSNDDPLYMLEQITYWFGLFSHQRETFTWRGMVAVPLDSDDNDNSARDMLRIMEGLP